ncbi:MAG: sigma-54-dependent Fis family transcriptional regulator [Deltaproteobacteria bacterium]|nr:sigma-54-dependent Fis family transcriptional regulator [Deltaproteobacteria bacterium]
MEIKKQKSVLLASQDLAVLKAVREYFDPDYIVDWVSKPQDCLARFSHKRYEYALVEVGFLLFEKQDLNTEAYEKVLEPYEQAFKKVPMIILAPPKQVRQAVRLVQAGAQDYLSLPIDPLEIKLVIESLQSNRQQGLELDYLRDQFWKLEAQAIAQTKTPIMEAVFKKIQLAAPTMATVLLQGETGTGKGLLAKLIHQHSQRSGGPFISVHCGAIPENLVESELFGHEKGAFTGALARKLGKFEAARGGTIFLDEIATMPYSSQVKLLQIIQDKIFQRVGGVQVIESDVRVIAATNTHLKSLVEEGKFREDLYFRLNIFPIEVPSLRERVEDIPLLVEIFLKNLNRKYLKPIEGVEPRVIEGLKQYPWPGNIRELENLIERAYILEKGSKLSQASFPAEIFNTSVFLSAKKIESSLSLSEFRQLGVEKLEKQYLRELLSLHQGKIKDSAQAAGIGTRQLHKLLSKYGIKKEDYKRIS